MSAPDLRRAYAAALQLRPSTADELHAWLLAWTGFDVPRVPVCQGHQAPFDVLAKVFLDSPPELLHLGSRGSGKSFGMGLLSDLRSRWHPRHGTIFLGGSLAQSRQGYGALEAAVWRGPTHQGMAARDALEHLGRTEARYRNGSVTSIIAASSRSVHGPHAEDVYRDERDEMPDEIAEAAVGMRRGSSGLPNTLMTASTWHRPSGSMAREIESARERKIPFFTTCLYDVLERCPETYSGPPVGAPDLYEHCPTCPLRPSCHSEVVAGEPKAKRARGHYPIAIAASTAGKVSPAVWASDYLCSGAKAAGVWFERFDPSPGANYRPDLAYDPGLPSFGLSIDSGVWTAALFYQVADVGGIDVRWREVRFLYEDVSYDLGAANVGARLKEAIRVRYNDRPARVSTDPAGDARTAIGGRVVIGLYEDAGLGSVRRPILRWPRYPGSLLDQLDLVDALVEAADGRRRLIVGPGCPQLLKAFSSYRRRIVRGVFTGEPEQEHPTEDLLDACRGACAVEFPDGVRLQRRGPAGPHGGPRGVSAASVF